MQIIRERGAKGERVGRDENCGEGYSEGYYWDAEEVQGVRKREREGFEMQREYEKGPGYIEDHHEGDGADLRTTMKAFRTWYHDSTEHRRLSKGTASRSEA
jgi:hypothetical protein